MNSPSDVGKILTLQRVFISATSIAAVLAVTILVISLVRFVKTVSANAVTEETTFVPIVSTDATTSTEVIMNTELLPDNELADQYWGELEELPVQVINEHICSEKTALTLRDLLIGVVEGGTGDNIKNETYSIAGKTGTAVTSPNAPTSNATFVGFFPAEDPRYSVICTVFSKPTSKQFQGGGIPARAIKSLVNGIYSIDPCFQPTLSASK